MGSFSIVPIGTYAASANFHQPRDTTHPMMRRSLLANFHRVWIDNLNGDKFKTGKVIPKGLPGEGTADQSAFTTDHDPRGIQPGTAIVTWLKLPIEKTKPDQTEVAYRDLWGLANWKRAALLAGLHGGDPHDGGAVPAYGPIKPSPENRWRLSPHAQEPGYESWPGLDELFPVNFQAVNPSRGLDGSVIDGDRDRLAERIKAYFVANSFDDMVARFPAFGVKRANYKPREVWGDMCASFKFEPERVLPYLIFPYDQRWIYYSEHPHFLDRHSPDFARNRTGNEFLITVPEPRKVSETRPLFATTLVGLHVHERGSVAIPRETRADGLLADCDANMPEPAWRILREHFGLTGERRDGDARGLAGRLLRVALAVLHAPAYQTDHRSALSADWAHLPVPKDVALFGRLAEMGELVARLLDANSDARDQVVAVLGEERAAHLAQFRRADGGPVTPKDLRVTINYWGGAKGRWVPRPFSSEGGAPPAWGEQTGDLYIADDVFFSNVPDSVWRYDLGGYPVLKKWLGYRQGDRRDGEPLTADERRWFRSMVQRIAALLALSERLDELYSASSEGAFTAAELGIQR